MSTKSGLAASLDRRLGNRDVSRQPGSGRTVVGFLQLHSHRRSVAGHLDGTVLKYYYLRQGKNQARLQGATTGVLGYD